MADKGLIDASDEVSIASSRSDSLSTDEDSNVPRISPVFINSSIMFATTAIQLIADTIITSFVAHLGGNYSAARGIANTVIGFSFFLFGFLVDGTTAQVSHSLGEKNREVLGGTIKISVLAGFVAGLMTLLIFGPAYNLWLLPFDRPDINYIVIPYFFVRLAGMPFNLVYNSLSGVLQGLHRVHVILLINIFISGIDILANYAFIYWLHWDIVGAPLGINVAFIGGMFVSFWYLQLPNQRALFTFFPLRKYMSTELVIQRCYESLNLMGRTCFVEFAIYLVSIFISRSGQDSFVAYSSVLSEISKYSYFIPMALSSAANMLGSYYVGQRDVVRFTSLVRIIQMLGFVLAVIFTCIAAFLVREIAYYLVGSGQFDSVMKEVDSCYALLVISQPINCMLIVYEGFMYATQSFAYMRNVNIAAFCVVFLPLLISAVMLPSYSSLTSLWGSLVAFYFCRLTCYAYHLHFVRLPIMRAEAQYVLLCAETKNVLSDVI